MNRTCDFRKNVNTGRTALLILFLSCFLMIATASTVYGVSSFYLKVGLSYGYQEVTSVRISCVGGLAIVEMKDRSYEILATYPEEKAFTAVIEGGVVSILKENGETLYTDFSVDQAIFPYEEGAVIYAGAEGYRGGFCFYPVENQKMNLINYVELEDYVKGVVHSEIGQSSPLEAIKAQAICARSYAICNLNRHRAFGYDICATTHCQVYKGYRNEFPSTNRASEETEGLVIYYQGNPVPAYYSKNDGGHTDNVEDVWGSKIGYLRGVRDEFSPLYSWEKSYTFEELGALLRQSNYSVGNISSITITKRNASGTVARIAIWDERKQTILTGNQLRTVLGANTIKSGMFSFSPISPESLHEALDNATTQILNSGNITAINLGSQRSYSKTLQIVGKDGIIRDAEASQLSITDGKTLVVPGSSSDSTQNAFTPVVTLGTESQLKSPVTFYGLGWGHGVGMAQDSIIAMGKLGYNYQFMLDYFFTDITIAPFNP
jgi:stage II sporulation protein D